MPIERLLDHADSARNLTDLYDGLHFPAPPEERPYTVVNMVSSVDGKTLIGGRGSTAQGLGGSTDQLLMRRIQGSVDAAILGAETLRAGNVVYRPDMWRAVVTRSGEMSTDNRFFTDAPDRAIVFAAESLPPAAREKLGKAARVEIAGAESVEAREAARILRHKYGIRSLALEGGATLNFQFFEAGLLDELFLTVAPKIKGGANLPTIVDGAGLPDRQFIDMELLSLYRDGDELYFRYRVGRRRQL